MIPASLILVNYRSPELVMDAVQHLESLPGENPRQTIVVDNSADRGLETALGTRVDYVAAPHNLGFAGGVNLGLQQASEDVVILLNPDARPERDCLRTLVDALQQDPGVGIAAPQLLPLSPQVAPVPSATRRDPGFLTLLAEYTLARRVIPSGWLDKNYFFLPGAVVAPTVAAMVQGACLAFRRELTDQIGVFDEERFFLYWEETDFCRRTRQAGWHVLYCPQVRCRHLGGGSTPEPRLARRHFWWGLLEYYRKHEGTIPTLLLRSALLAGTALNVVLLSTLRLARPGDNTLRQDLAENRERIGLLLAHRSPERPA